MSGITTGNLRLISQELLDALNDSFRPPVIEANTSVEEIKWAAAQREVIEWIQKKAASHQTVGSPSQEPGRPTATGAYVRLGQ